MTNFDLIRDRITDTLLNLTEKPEELTVDQYEDVIRDAYKAVFRELDMYFIEEKELTREEVDYLAAKKYIDEAYKVKMGNPLEAVDNLVKQAKDITEKYSPKATRISNPIVAKGGEDR